MMPRRAPACACVRACVRALVHHRLPEGVSLLGKRGAKIARKLRAIRRKISRRLVERRSKHVASRVTAAVASVIHLLFNHLGKRVHV